MHLRNLVLATLGIKRHRVVLIKGSTRSLKVSLEVMKRRLLPCSCCGRLCRVHDRLPQRSWRHVPLWGVPVWLFYRPCRVTCPSCGIRVEKIPWAMGKSTLSKPLILTLAVWSRRLAIKTVAELYGVHWNTVYRAVQSAVSYGLAHRDQGTVQYLGIDEISRSKGHIYHTQVYDLTTKTLLWSGEGRREETLKRFFDDYGLENLQQVKAICCDMWKPYAKAVRENLPQVAIVFDKFHIVRYLLDAVDEVRRSEASTQRTLHTTTLKGMRYLLLKNPWRLTDAEATRLETLEEINHKVHQAWLLKEQFRQLWDAPTPDDAKVVLERWIAMADASTLKPMQRLAKRFRNRGQGVLNWFDHNINNGAVEAMNNNAKAVSHRSRGFRTEQVFTTILYHNMGGLDLPNYHHKFW